MISILDTISKSRLEFRPQDVREFFVLRIAQKFNCTQQLHQVAKSCSQLTLDSILKVYRDLIKLHKANCEGLIEFLNHRKNLSHE